MRKFLLPCLIVVVAFLSALAGVPTLATIGNVDFQLDTCNQSGATIDTIRLTGATSDTFVVKHDIEPGWSYVLTTTDSINAVTDSIQLRCIVYGSDNTTVMGNILVGTDSTTANYCHLLPIGVTGFGNSFSLRYTRVAATTKTAIYRWELYKVRTLTADKPWNRK